MTTRPSAIATACELAELDEEQRYELFDRLQLAMPRVWDAMRLNEPNESVVVVPSVTLDRLGEGSGSLTQATRSGSSSSCSCCASRVCA